ncbi:MAG TPA: acyl-CoA dehydrogenase family protein [Candidatus Tumulicola sp.]|jgi:alkylation response protein AidB-like acyl-CoA dehydrogenase|nr:acyl-CoA dehydrogenase family protein [Candidatus Tumulicola sp.]
MLAPERTAEMLEAEQMILDTVRKLVREKVEPRAMQIDATGEYPKDLRDLFAKNDLLGIPFPEEYGGLGSFLTYVKVVEEISKACASSALIVAVQELGALPIMISGTEAQKKKYLPKLATGELMTSYALTEPTSGSDASNMRTSAVRDGDHYVLNGTKVFITNVSVADICIVFAMTDKEQGSKGISAFICHTDDPGFKLGKVEHKMGIRGSPTNEVVLENCRVPADRLLGAEGEGFKIAMRTLDKSRPGVAAQALGIAQGALDFAAKYIKERVAFGKPLSKQQGLQWMIADMDLETQAARLLLYEAARKCDESAPDVTYWGALCKLKCGDVAMSVTTDAVQLVGGYGYMTEYPVERMMRDAKITQIYEGTQQIQRIVIGRHILGK